MSILQRCAISIVTGLLFATAALTPARAAEPAQDENLAYTIGVQAYVSHFPLMDLYRTLWETSFDPGRGHDRTLNEFFVFDRLITSKDDWVITPNNDTIYLRAFLDLRKEPIILVIPPMGDRQYWVPVSDMWHDFDANLSWDTVGARGGASSPCAHPDGRACFRRACNASTWGRRSSGRSPASPWTATRICRRRSRCRSSSGSSR